MAFFDLAKKGSSLMRFDPERENEPRGTRSGALSAMAIDVELEAAFPRLFAEEIPDSRGLNARLGIKRVCAGRKGNGLIVLRSLVSSSGGR